MGLWRRAAGCRSAVGCWSWHQKERGNRTRCWSANIQSGCESGNTCVCIHVTRRRHASHHCSARKHSCFSLKYVGMFRFAQMFKHDFPFRLTDGSVICTALSWKVYPATHFLSKRLEYSNQHQVMAVDWLSTTVCCWEPERLGTKKTMFTHMTMSNTSAGSKQLMEGPLMDPTELEVSNTLFMRFEPI